MHAPSVVVLGYAPKSRWGSPLYCRVMLPDGSSVCLPKETVVKQQCHCNRFIHYTDYESVYHICILDPSHPVPASVSLSSAKDCSSATKDINVYNFRPEKKHKFGVCIHSPVFGNVYNDAITSFIEMNRVLGAEIFTVYSKNKLNKLMDRHGDVLDFVEWPSFIEKKNIAHYYGQTMVIHDCLYRNMHRVDYLFFIDNDELIVPANANTTWSTVIEEMERTSQDTFSALIFKNVYYMYLEGESEEYLQLCDLEFRTPKYLTHFKRSVCKYRASRRSKVMVKPQEVFEMDIHSMCVGVHHEVVVPPTLASLHHYRKSITYDCKTHAYTVDTGMRAYRDQLIDRLNTTLCH